MNLKSTQYEQAVNDFLKGMGCLERDLIAIVLYGSLARGDIRPGQSDILDAYVYLRGQVFETREQFTRALEIMVAACSRLQEYGLPFHPFHYFSEDEINKLPAVYLATWKRNDSSALLKGEDVRPRIDSSEISWAVGRLSFFNARRTMGHFLCQYLKRDFRSEECQSVVKALVSLKKNLMPMACLVLDIWTTSEESVRELEKAFVGIDVSALDSIEKFRSSSGGHDPNEVKDVIRETLIFVEDLHDRLLRYLKQDKDHSLSKSLKLIGFPGPLFDQ